MRALVPPAPVGADQDLCSLAYGFSPSSVNNGWSVRFAPVHTRPVGSRSPAGCLWVPGRAQ